MGDLNARLGSKQDFTDIDNLQPRVILDNTENNHGKALREFLLDSKCCILKSRVTPQHDNFTFVSTRGISVVDYVITPHDCLKQVSKCNVDLCSDIINNLGIQNVISDMCKSPDHSLVTITTTISLYHQIESRMLGAKNFSNPTTHCPNMINRHPHRENVENI